MQTAKHQIFYGWYIVAACFVVAFIVFGISVNTFTVYIKPIQEDLGWSRGKIAFGVTISAIAMGMSAPFIGRLIDRVGARWVMAAGASAIGVLSILLSQSRSLPYFLGLYALAGVAQAGATLIPISLVISNWFSAKRGMALGIVMTGTGLGAMVMVPVTSLIVVNWGWRTSYMIMGCIILLVAPLNLLVIRTKPSEKGLLPDGGLIGDSKPIPASGLSISEAFHTRRFWLIGAMMLLFGLVAMGVGVHLMPYLTDIGHRETTAGLLIATVSGMTVLGKIGTGFVADRWGLRSAVMITCAMILVGIVLLMRADIFGVAVVFAIVYGFAIGAPLLINPGLTAECMGLAHFGAIFGILTLLNTAGAAIGATLTGVIYDLAGGYWPAFTLFIVLISAAAYCGVSAKRAAISVPMVEREEIGI